MRKGILIAVAMMVLAFPAFAQSVQIDYAHDFDFGSVKTFQYADTPESNIKGNDLMAARVVEMIKKELRDGGLTEVSSDPDLYVTYHYAAEDKKSWSTSNFGYGGYWDAWGGWGISPGMGSSVTREYTYTEGTLVIDAYDSNEKKMIWRGSGTVTVKEKPEKQIKQVEKILRKLGKRWDKILAGKGK